jgi:metal-responsive CopG/Arc/MetJ family transcriptional regulator
MAMKVVRTTLALPADLLERGDHVVRGGEVRSRSAFVARALRRELATLEAAAIDADLAGMADEEYQAEALALAEDFSSEEWEAFRRAEGDQ